MAKTHKLSTKWDVDANGVMLFEQSGVDEKDAPVGKYTVTLNLADHGYNDLPSDAAKEALAFGFFTALRNGTGSCDLITEAEETVKKRIEAFAEGEWGAERAPSAVPFHAKSPLVLAIIKAGAAADASEVVPKLNERAEATIKANNVAASFAAADDKARGKVRKAVMDDTTKRYPKIAAALAGIQAEITAAAAARKAEAASKALAAAEGVESDGGF